MKRTLSVESEPTYTCAKCGGVFEYAWTDEEAEAERQEKYPSFSQAECDIVCDDCFKQVDAWVTNEGLPR